LVFTNNKNTKGEDEYLLTGKITKPAKPASILKANLCEAYLNRQKKIEKILTAENWRWLCVFSTNQHLFTN